MNLLMISMRLIHIFAGVFWVGASMFILGFVQPTVIATGAEGQKFMQHLSFRTRFATAMAAVAILTFLSGLVMYWQISGFSASFLSSGYGLVLTLGGIAGFLALLSGYFIQNRTMERMKTLGAAMGAAGGPPTPEQQAEMGRLAQTVARGGQITTFMLVIALIGMSVAQYVAF